jgi:hypothetical protein
MIRSRRWEPNRSPNDSLVAFPIGPTAPQRAHGSAKAPVKASPGPSSCAIPNAVALAVAAWAQRYALGRRDKSYRLTRFITWQVATIAWVGLVPLWV